MALETQDRDERRKLLASDLDANDIASLHAALGGGEVDSDDPAATSVGRRLALAYAEPPLAPPDVLSTDEHGITRLQTAPPMRRTPLAPEAWSTNPFVRFGQRLKNWADRGYRRRQREAKPTPRWQWIASARRWVLLVLIFGQSVVAANQMRTVLPYQGQQWLEIAILALFVLLFG